EENRVMHALNQNPPNESDPVDRMLRGFLTGWAPALTDLSRDELAAARDVSAWLRKAGFVELPTGDEIVGRFDWKALLEPFEHLAGKHFGGRKSELAMLRSYVDVLPPSTLSGKARASLARVLNITQKPTLVICGPGGVGKSTLVARF